MVLVAASLGLVLYSVAGISGIGIRDRGAHRADLPDPLQCGVDAAARPHRRRQPDRGSVARHRRPRPPGRRIRAPARRGRGPGGVGKFGRRRPHPGRRSARSTNSACWSSNSRFRSPATRICCPSGAAAAAASRPASRTRRSNRAAAPPAAAAKPAPSRRPRQRRDRRGPRPRAARRKSLAAVKNAVEENRIDIYLQPMVTLPQRKVRYYEAVTRLRDDEGSDSRRRRFHRRRRGRRADRADRSHW